MRILMVTPWFPVDSKPSSGVFVLRDAQALKREHAVTVVHLDSLPGARRRAGTDVVDGVSVLRVPFARTNLFAWGSVRKAVREAARGADVVHTHALPGIVPFAFSRPAGQTWWVHTEHWSGLTSPETLSAAGRLARRVLMPILRRPDVVVSAAERLSSVIRTVRRGPVAYVPCVVAAPERVVPTPGDPLLLRLIGVGGIIARKGPLVALDAVAELRRRGVSASLTWVGEGPQHAELENAAQRLGLRDSLHVTGTLDEQGVGEALDAHDIFVLPTLGDNFCIVVAEALSHGRAVVSGTATGAVDYSSPDVSEFVAEHSGVAFAEAILRVRAKVSHLSASEIARTVHGAFSPTRVADLLISVYSDTAV